MQQPKQPMYQKGDKVVYVYIDADGQEHPEICTVDDIILGECIVYYELLEHSEVVMESELKPLEEIEMVEEEEHFTFTQHFDYDDEVYVEGYDDEIYIVKGVIIEIFRYKNEEWTEVSYELEREDLCIYAYDEDMSLVSEDHRDQSKREARQNHLSHSNTEPSQLKDKLELPSGENRDVNTLLDDYNDYIALYKLFGDIEYKELAESVIESLKDQSARKLV
jgi:hypothetical protein